MSGNLAINSYMKTIFNQASTGLDSSQSSIIATGITIPASKYNICIVGIRIRIDVQCTYTCIVESKQMVYVLLKSTRVNSSLND